MTIHDLAFGCAVVTLSGAVCAGVAGLPGQTDPPDPAIPAPKVLGERSAADFGFSAGNSADQNRQALQRAIDWASPLGGTIRINPSASPYPIAPGLVLRQNVSLVGAHGPVGRGTRSADGKHPVGSVLEIRGGSADPFLTVETATQVNGLQFWYPEQTLIDPAKVIKYPPTIRVSQDQAVWGVTLRNLTFYGEYLAMDFVAREGRACEQVLIEHCYGYPLGGEFVRIDRCYDVPRILHCHVNPATMRAFAGDFRREVIDSVIARGTYAYAIDHTDNAVLMDVFTFGTFGGVKLGAASYGQLTSFNFDCVSVGIFKDGDSAFNRNWMVAQGSIIANAGGRVEDIHPVVVQGQGHLSISSVEAFSGPNAVVTTKGRSWDFLLLRGDAQCTVSLTGCRMRNYESQEPLTRSNPRASILATACFDKAGKVFELRSSPEGQ